ncbi:histidine triad nucleotide-binding protein [Frondihabitans sucicola]|uniref:Histidine triad nucleotide-binding protein n=1 Tax=Frondihabitans sucicola TaxID=1268041 RepID=A0ABM8GR34_9MICO|nr:histidine triad nucleotide-binding protein [Frondihabitans sucicola]BDZ50923.1 histidine triad nucleotide-binding protein [Frondihabitans sucicola]
MSHEQETEPSIFTRIVRREIPATIVYESETVIAFHDIAPKAPVHLLVVPKTQQYANVVELAAGDPGLLADVVAVGRSLAEDPSLMKEFPLGQFRLIFNTGEAVGQTVFHVHAHVMAGNLQEGSLA